MFHRSLTWSSKPVMELPPQKLGILRLTYSSPLARFEGLSSSSPPALLSVSPNIFHGSSCPILKHGKPVMKLPPTRFTRLGVSTNVRFLGKCKSMVENSKSEPLLPSTSKESWLVVFFSQIKGVLLLRWFMLVRKIRKWPPTIITSCSAILLTSSVLYWINGGKQAAWDSIEKALYCFAPVFSHAKLETFSEEFVGHVAAFVFSYIFKDVIAKEFEAIVNEAIAKLLEAIERFLRRCFGGNHTIICGENNNVYNLLEIMNSHCDPLICRQRIYYICDISKRKLNKLSVKWSKDLNNIDLLLLRGKLTDTNSNIDVKSTHAIIILPEKKNRYEADMNSILSVEALQPILKGTSIPIIVEVSNSNTSQLLETFSDINVEIVESFVVELLVRSSMQKSMHLNAIYMHLLRENVFNFFDSRNLVGTRYGEIRKKFEGATLCGLNRNGNMDFHPSEDEIIKENDKVLFIGNMTTKGVPKKNVKYPTVTSLEARHLGQDSRLLVVGWRQDAACIMKEYDKYLGPNSIVHMLSDVPINERERAMQLADVDGFKNLSLFHKFGDPMNFDILRKNILNIKGDKNNSLSVIVISDREWNNKETERSDKRNVYCLRSIQKICKELGIDVDILIAQVSDPKLGKMMSDFDRDLMYISIEEITSLITAQVAEDKMLNGIWRTILKANEVDICLKDIELYRESNEKLSFWELAERANIRREVVIGFLKNDKEMVINPISKREPLCLDIAFLILICARDI